ncbi:DMT family transporter [Mycolicibacterium vaccae]|uniref:DMT family transporter n=1 Tax=Mycolicibacterium vaccae TaxID=1810 RepID=UPI003D0279B7
MSVENTTPATGIVDRHLRGNPARGATAVVLGAGWISMNGVFISFAEVSSATVVVFRCLLALPVLAALAANEIRDRGPMPARTVALCLAAGGVMGIDFALATQALTLIGVGVSTVLTNVQIVVVPLLAWVFLRRRVPGRFVAAAPVFLLGMVLLGGGLSGGDGVAGLAMALGSGVAYAVYLFIIGQSSAARHPATALFLATSSACVVGGLTASSWGTVDFTPGWGALGWLCAVALGGQVVGWMLIAHGLPLVPAETGATLLLITPVGALAAGMIFLAERPSATQLAGCVIVITAIWSVSRAAPPSGRPPG